MTILFWLIITLMIVLALAFILLPLLKDNKKNVSARQYYNLDIYRERLAELEEDYAANRLNQTDYEAARLELERSLLVDADVDVNIDTNIEDNKESRKTPLLIPLVIGIAIPLIAIILYINIGSVGLVAVTDFTKFQASQKNQKTPSADDINKMLQQLKSRLASNPNDVEGWVVLGRSYVAMNSIVEANFAFEKAYALAPKNSEILLDYAETLAKLNNKNLSGKPAELIQQALEIQPNSKRGLWLSGVVAFQQGDKDKAIAIWQGLLASKDTTDEERRVLSTFIMQAKGQGSAVNKPANANQSNSDQNINQSNTDVAITVSISLDKALANKANPNDTVFIFARATNNSKKGTRMPLAIVKKQVRDLPVTVTLDDSQAMMPAMTLSSASSVVVGARVSKSGDAMPAAGDLEGLSEPIELNNQSNKSIKVDFVIDKVL